MYLLQKCLLVACVFMLCPKRSSFTSLSGRIRKVYKPDPNKVIKSPFRTNGEIELLKKSNNQIRPLNNDKDQPKELNSEEKVNVEENDENVKELTVEELEHDDNPASNETASDVTTTPPPNGEDQPKETSAEDGREPGFDLTDEEIAKFKIWPRGIIPYFIDDFSFDKVLRDRIRGFLDSVNTASGLNFIELPRPPTDDSRWLFFINRRGQLDCADISTSNFSNSGVQKLLLGYNCMSSGAALAEIVLALAGVPPQHNAPNRDDYIQVQAENIMPDKKNLFDILKDDQWLFHDIDYDFASASHYDFHKHTVNGVATLKPVKTVKILVGEGDGFSRTDILKIQMLYNYISRKKQTNAPECSKLFKRGDKFSSYKPKSDNEVKPRKKPNKYQGLPDDANDEEKNEIDENETKDKNDENEAKDDNDENKESGTNNKEGDLDDDEKVQLLNKGRKRVIKRGKRTTRKIMKHPDLFQRSDYETNERK